jgi:2-polyprenyl-6-methoxyphenol hydroxylase-like FAD-dependent oxidoreductase
VTSLDIAIAGAGPGGLAAALFLSRAGHRVRLFERFERPRPVGSGLMLQPTGLAVLDALGLAPAIRRLGAPVDRLTGTDAKSGRTVLEVGYGPLGRGVQALGVHRSALFQVLHDAVTEAGLPIRSGYTVTQMQRDHSRNWLLSPQGLEGPFDLVVDALGSQSPLKPHARAKGRIRPLEYGAIWGTTPWVDAGFDRQALTQRYRGSSVMIGVLPIGRTDRSGPDLAAFFWSLKPADYAAVLQRGFEAWRRPVEALWPAAVPHIEALGGFERMTLARYQHHTLPVPAGDGIAFIGDSAHSTSPQLGQGANMALLDAAALTAALAATGTVDEALERYAGMRRWHVRLYQILSLTLTPFYQSDSRIMPVLRDLLVGSVARIPPMPGLLAGMVAGQLLNPLKAIGLDLLAGGEPR